MLVVPPSNDAGFDPNRSFLPAETTRAEREAFARDFLFARRSEDSEPARAIKLYRTLLDRQPGFAETHYRLGLLLDHAGAWDEAYRHFVAARDFDGLPMRCLSSFQQVYRDVAAKHQCILVDGQALFHAIGPHGLLDDHLFHDAMHPSLLGHIALAQGIVDALYARRALAGQREHPRKPSTQSAVLPTSACNPKTGSLSASEGTCSTTRPWACGTTGRNVWPSRRHSRQPRNGSLQASHPRQSACPTSGPLRAWRFGPISTHAPVTVVLAIPNFLRKRGLEREQRQSIRQNTQTSESGISRIPRLLRGLAVSHRPRQSRARRDQPR